MQSKQFFISRNFMHKRCGGTVAKTDIELILEELGYVNIGFKRSYIHNNIAHALLNFFGVIKALLKLKKGSRLILQYPMCPYYELICKIAKWRKNQIITIIHDLRSFRNKSITPNEEIPRLELSDVLLTHNHVMRKWLSEHGCKTRMIDYEIMDYIHGESSLPHRITNGNYSIFYVGTLSSNSNDFLYQLAEIMPETDFYLYGYGIESERIQSLPNVHYMGVIPDTEIIRNHKGDFGLSWYGESLDDGVGKIGEYMKYNNPHKVSLYLRCNSPVIVWKKAGRAKFIEDNGIGIAIDNLHELKPCLESLASTEYDQLASNVQIINIKLKEGFYLKKALAEANKYLNTLN